MSSLSCNTVEQKVPAAQRMRALLKKLPPLMVDVSRKIRQETLYYTMNKSHLRYSEKKMIEQNIQEMKEHMEEMYDMYGDYEYKLRFNKGNEYLLDYYSYPELDAWGV